MVDVVPDDWRASSPVTAAQRVKAFGDAVHVLLADYPQVIVLGERVSRRQVRIG